jgi:hypothetical protein
METEKFVEEQRIKKSLAPGFWKKLSTDFQLECTKVASTGVNMRFDLLNDGAFHITNFQKGRRASFRYDPNVPCIFGNINGKETVIAFKVDESGNNLFLNEQIPGAREGRLIFLEDVIFQVMHDLTR